MCGKKFGVSDPNIWDRKLLTYSQVTNRQKIERLEKLLIFRNLEILFRIGRSSCGIKQHDLLTHEQSLLISNHMHCSMYRYLMRFTLTHKICQPDKKVPIDFFALIAGDKKHNIILN